MPEKQFTYERYMHFAIWFFGGGFITTIISMTFEMPEVALIGILAFFLLIGWLHAIRAYPTSFNRYPELVEHVEVDYYVMGWGDGLGDFRKQPKLVESVKMDLDALDWGHSDFQPRVYPFIIPLKFPDGSEKWFEVPEDFFYSLLVGDSKKHCHVMKNLNENKMAKARNYPKFFHYTGRDLIPLLKGSGKLTYKEIKNFEKRRYLFFNHRYYGKLFINFEKDHDINDSFPDASDRTIPYHIYFS